MLSAEMSHSLCTCNWDVHSGQSIKKLSNENMQHSADVSVQCTGRCVSVCDVGPGTKRSRSVVKWQGATPPPPTPTPKWPHPNHLSTAKQILQPPISLNPIWRHLAAKKKPDWRRLHGPVCSQHSVAWFSPPPPSKWRELKMAKVQI